MISLGTSSGCSGGALPGLGQSGGVTFDVQLQGEGREWIGRPRTPERGDFQLTLQTRDDSRLFTGTMRGRVLDDSSSSGQGSLDVHQPATVDGSVSFFPPVLVVGRVNGELVYDEPSARRVTCTSAIWSLERPGQL